MLKRGIGFGRSSLDASPRDRRFMQTVTGEVLPHAGFFVPAFSVRRQLRPNEAAIEFQKQLADFCERKPYEPYKLDRMGITILDKSRFVDMFHRADVQPDATDMLTLALNVREALQSQVKSKPHSLRAKLGGIAIFGNHDNKIAASLEGWKGFSKHYAAQDDDGQVSANRQLVGEINATVGEITQFVDGGVNGNGVFVDISTRALERQTPHFTFAEKVRGGSVSNSERVDLNGQIMEFMPPELDFFDPVIHLRLQRPGHDMQPYTNNPSEVSIESSGLFVRRPKFRDFGGAVLEQCVTAGAA